MSGAGEARSGACLCGRVRFTVTGPLRDVVACHCSQCRRQSGHFWAATNAPHEAIALTGEENLVWYEASEKARRGFCAACGSFLFWQERGSHALSIAAGAFEAPTGLKLVQHIFVDDKGDYYDLEDGLPQRSQ
jgi:hypothetical protein